MSAPSEENTAAHAQLASHFVGDLLDSIIVDAASECHRIARLGLDRNLEDEEEELRLSTQAGVRAADPGNSGEANSMYVVDIFGQTHPPVANEVFECMNCGRSIMAGRFAPHLEKCMGKGRKARLKAVRSSAAAQNRHSRGSPASAYSPYSNSNGTTRFSNGSTSVGQQQLFSSPNPRSSSGKIKFWLNSLPFPSCPYRQRHLHTDILREIQKDPAANISCEDHQSHPIPSFPWRKDSTGANTSSLPLLKRKTLRQDTPHFILRDPSVPLPSNPSKFPVSY